MEKVFISYSTKDKYFAELLSVRLEGHGIEVWRDISEIRAGDQWRDSIDQGLRESAAIIVALSQSSCASHYVTYEWATAAAQGKTVIPVLLEDCTRHPKLEPIQYIDFKSHNSASWDGLAQRVKEILDQQERVQSESEKALGTSAPLTSKEETAKKEIKAYLSRKGFRVVSFQIIRKNIDKALSDEFLTQLVEKSPEFATAKVRIKRPTGSSLQLAPNVAPDTRPGLRWL